MRPAWLEPDVGAAEPRPLDRGFDQGKAEVGRVPLAIAENEFYAKCRLFAGPADPADPIA